MSLLLDTNVVSEWVASTPNPSLVSWLGGVDEDTTFLSVILWVKFVVVSIAFREGVGVRGWETG